jgi:hypothetical protein
VSPEAGESAISEYHVSVRVDYVSTGDGHYSFWLGNQIVDLLLDGAWVQQIVLADELREFTLCCRTGGSPVPGSCGATGLLDDSDAGIGKCLEEIKAGVGAPAFGKHDVQICVRLGQEGIHEWTQMRHAVVHRHDYRDQGLHGG